MAKKQQEQTINKGNPIFEDFLNAKQDYEENEKPKTKDEQIKALEAELAKQKEATAQKEAELERLKRKETKSRRVQLVLEPTIYDKIKAYADINELSINEAITQAIIKITLDI